jgi:hypothetical protein
MDLELGRGLLLLRRVTRLEAKYTGPVAEICVGEAWQKKQLLKVRQFIRRECAAVCSQNMTLVGPATNPSFADKRTLLATFLL